MEVNDKIKELEDELKLLKAEIRNVLLDIREVVLERKNPLGEEHESAHLTLDLNTTARAMAAEAVASEAFKATDAATEVVEGDDSSIVSEPGSPDEQESVGVASEEPGADRAPQPEPDSEHGEGTGGEPVTPEQAVTAEPAAEPQLESDSPAATATREPQLSASDTEIPEMFMADLAPLSGDGSLAEWVTNAIDTVGVDDLRRVIVMFRLWGNVPPNISRALAHLQELLASSDEPRPAWLKVLQDLDRLASL